MESQNRNGLLSIIIIYLIGVNIASAWGDPEAPAIMRRVDTVSDGKFSYPTLPAVSSTQDGRLGISRDLGGPGFNYHGMLRIMLLKPEAITSKNKNKNFLQMEASNEPIITAGTGEHVVLDGYMQQAEGIWSTYITDQSIRTKTELLALPAKRTGNQRGSALLSAASGDAFIGSGLMGAGGSMPLLCEENRDQYGAVLEEIEEVRNPYACSVTHDPEKVPGERFQIDKSGGDHDCYDLAIIMNGSTVMRDVNENGSASMPYTKLVSRRITVAITSPKTPEAQIVAVKSEGYEIAENELIGGTWLEPNITSDGKLIVTRIGTNYHPINEENVAACEDIAEYPGNWPNSGQTPICRSVDVVYSYNPGTRCDVNGFTAYQPMAHAYWDDRLNPEVNRDSNTGNDVDAKYGFAAHQLRSPDGKYFEDNQDVQGSYAWMDRHGDNFMVTIGGTQTYDSGEYEFPYKNKTQCVGDLEVCANEEHSLARHPNNVTWSPVIAGSWTRGKMIFMDNLLNHSDYAMGVNNWEEKLFDIYENGGPVRVSGRYVTHRKDPIGSVGNTDFFESIENRFNFQDEFKPASFRDVVWKMSSGTVTDEFIFDDYISRYTYIMADMVGARLLDHPTNTVSDYSARLLHYPDGSGGNNNYLTQVQNGATALTFSVPSVGNVVNYGANNDKPRIEPVALGGIKGRGLWLNGSYGVDFAPEETSSLYDQNIYVGLFVDSHSGKDHVNRKLVTFPDASSVRTIKMNACYSQQVCADSIPFDNIGFFDAAGNLVASWDVTGILSSVVARRQEWVHLGFQINKLTASQTKVDIYINGYRFTEWYSSQGLIFKLTEDGSPINTPITIGASAENNGFLGWIDEFKVILQAQNPELACNHALGTLIGVDDESRDEWKSVADSFGGPLVNSSHDLITGLLQANKSKFYSQYACFHDYRGDHMATRNNVPSKLVAADTYESYGVHYGLLSTATKASVTVPAAMPLYHDQPRHDFSANTFCTGCHGNNERAKGLKVSALTLGAVSAIDDSRRQPTQPLDKIRGNIPASWKLPGSSALSQARGVFTGIDSLVLSSYEANEGDADVWSPEYELETSGTDPQAYDTDNDGVSDSSDSSPLINPNQYVARDTDGDSIPDYLDSDADNDLVDNIDDDCPYVVGSCTEEDELDLDADGIPDNIDTDIDGDGIPNGSDNCPLMGNPDQRDIFSSSDEGDACELDTDGDFMPDAWEIAHGFNKLDYRDADGDLDGDRLSNLWEYFYGTDPAAIDFDGDQIPDGWELLWGLNPVVQQRLSGWTYDLWGGTAILPVQLYLAVKDFPAYYNAVIDTIGVGDVDDDGYFDSTARWRMDEGGHVVPADNCLFVANANQLDSDDDGLGDACEENYYGTDPGDWDSDGDGMPDGWEIWWGLDPTNSSDATLDSDGDSLNSLAEYQNFKGAVYGFLDIYPFDNYPYCDLEDINERCDVKGYVRFEFAGGRGNPLFKDMDGDGMEDDWETANGLDYQDVNDANPDSDGDGLINYLEYMAGTDPFEVDTDGDDIPDGWEFEYGLDAIANDASSDSDFDGMPNLWEYLNGLHPGIYDRYDDLDGDGVQNIQEYQWGTDANNLDSDGDGLTDWEEAYLFSSFYQPQYADTDCAPPPYGINNCDGINDGDEDYDSDIMPNIWELVHGFDPTDPSDGITDADGDSLGNQAEYLWGTDPNNPDTDGDEHSDHKEVVLGSNALNRLDPPLLVLTSGDAAGAMLMGGIDDMDFENSTEAQDVFWNATDGSWIFEDVIEKQIADVSVTDTDICLLLSTGDAVCWNSEWSLTDVTKLVGNRGHVCVIQEGVVLCNPAGDDTHGQSTPTMGLSGVIDIAAGLQHTCALTPSAIDCWGDDSEDQSPAQFLPSPLAVAAGDKHTCAIIDGGVVQCWGDDTEGQLGDGADGDTYVDGVTDARVIVAGSNHTCVIEGDYLSVGGPTVKCWGAMDVYQSQVPVSLTDGTDIPVSIRSAGDQTCVIKAEDIPSSESTPVEDLMICWPVNIDTD